MCADVIQRFLKDNTHKYKWFSLIIGAFLIDNNVAVPLCRKAATHDSEIRYLFEEMEAQIENEKDRLLLKVPEGTSRRYSSGCVCSKSSSCPNFARLWSFHISPSPTLRP